MKNVARFTLLAAFCLAAPLGAKAQSAGGGVNYLRGYLFVAPGVETVSAQTKSAFAVGGGIEQLLWRWIGAGADLNAVIPGGQSAANTVGIASFNGYFHPVLMQNWDPFVTAGYSLLFRNFAANGFNFGGGVNYWVRENTGITFEIREEAGDHTPTGVPNHYLEFRIGLTFR